MLSDGFKLNSTWIEVYKRNTGVPCDKSILIFKYLEELKCIPGKPLPKGMLTNISHW